MIRRSMGARSHLPVLAWLLLAGPVAGQRVPDSYARDSVTDRLADLVRIHTPEGIEVVEELEVNGSRQWISIRGLNRANPVMLVLHGGPGSPLMGMSWAYQKPWEDFFTVVNWDQRGAGKSFSAADSARLGPTMTEEQLAEDAAVVIRHIRSVLGPRRIVVLAFSHGTVFGPLLVRKHPEWIAAYVTVGQTSVNNESELFRTLYGRVQAASDTATLRVLDAMRPYPPETGNPSVREMLAVRDISQRYDGGWYGKPDLSLYYRMWEWAPMYTREEAANVGPASGWTNRHLIDGTSGPRGPTVEEFSVPVIMLHGRYDLMTTYSGARAYFERVRAPRKEFVTFERSAHFIMFEEPGRFLLTLVNTVLPLAGGSAEFTPSR